MSLLIRLSGEDIELLTRCLSELVSQQTDDDFPYSDEELSNMIEYLERHVAEHKAQCPVLLKGGLMDSEMMNGGA